MPSLQKHCIECHGADTQEGDVRFDKLTGSPQEEPVWASILEQLEKGAMPPRRRTASAPRGAFGFHCVDQAEFPTGGAGDGGERCSGPRTATSCRTRSCSTPRLRKKAQKSPLVRLVCGGTLPVSYRDKMDAWLKSHGAIDAKRGYGGDVLAAPFGLQTAQEIKNYSFLYTLEGAQTAGLANNARLALIRGDGLQPEGRQVADPQAGRGHGVAQHRGRRQGDRRPLSPLDWPFSG